LVLIVEQNSIDTLRSAPRHLQESISNRQDEQIPEINEFLSWQMSDDPDDNDDDDPEEQEENS
jgi:hypothetical protein